VLLANTTTIVTPQQRANHARLALKPIHLLGQLYALPALLAHTTTMVTPQQRASIMYVPVSIMAKPERARVAMKMAPTIVPHVTRITANMPHLAVVHQLEDMNVFCVATLAVVSNATVPLRLPVFVR